MQGLAKFSDAMGMSLALAFAVAAELTHFPCLRNLPGWRVAFEL